jgi:hypothetical protein
MLSEKFPRQKALSSAKWLIFISLVAAWATKTPYAQISDFIGANFYWPEDRSLKWPALLIERTIIESVVCLPVAYVLAWLYRRSLYVSIFLVLLYIPRATLDLSTPLSLSYTNAFVVFGIVVHVMLLLGGVFAFKNNS